MRAALVNLSRTRFFCWPVGLLSLASYAQARTGQKVEIIEADAGDPHEQLCGRGHYDVIGLSAMTANYEEATALAWKLKRSHPGSKLVIGGVHVSTLPASMRPCFDLAVPGEAEEKFIDLLEGRFDPANQYQRLELAGYPPLNYSLLDPRYFHRRYLGLWNEYGVPGMLLTSRGCPFRCVFCSSSKFWQGGKVRMFSPEWVINEIKAQVSLGVTHLSFWDDLFTGNKARLRTLAGMLKQEGINLKLTCQARADTIDDETCELLAGMGVKFVSFGFESGNERVLRWLKCSTTTVRDNENAIRLCRKHGLHVGGYLVLPPDATFKENMDTAKFSWKMLALGADVIGAYQLTPFPGTKIWEQAEARGQVSTNMNFDKVDIGDKRRIPRLVRWLLFGSQVLLRLRRMFRFRREFFASMKI